MYGYFYLDTFCSGFYVIGHAGESLPEWFSRSSIIS